MKKLRLLFTPAALLCSLLFCICGSNTKAQLTTTRAGNYGKINYLVNNILLGSGLKATGITYQGIDTSFGFFNGKASNLGMDSGVVITNGTITLCNGPNLKTNDKNDGPYTTYNYSTTDGWPLSNTYNDSDLASLIGTTYKNTYSCAVLQFDFIATSDSIQFQYVFGSNEEPYYVGSKYLDDFGFFLSGPGISGPFSHNAINLALVPSTTTAVYINSVSCTTNPAYYVCNWPSSTGCSSCPATTASTTVGYNGFTTVLTAKAAVQCGQKYHIKLGVANIGNGKFDSGVFLKAGSFTTTTIPLTVTPASPAVCLGDSVTITASGGTSYTWSPATGLSATTGASVTAKPAVTTTYTVVATMPAGCNDTVKTIVTVSAPPSISVSPSTSICSGNSTALTASGATTYTWTPAASLNSSTGTNVTATPGSTTTYTVTGTSPGCSTGSTQSVTVTVNPTPVVTVVPPSDTLCSGGSIALTAKGAGSYIWSPAGGLSCNNCSNPVANPAITTTYKVVGDSMGCTDSSSITVTVIPPGSASISLLKDSICAGNSTILTVTGTAGLNYLWNTGATTTSVTVTPATTTTYYVVAKDKCITDTLTKTVTVVPTPVPSVSGNDSVCAGTNTVLTASGGTSYLWNTGSTATSVTVAPGTTTTYTVMASNGTCSASASYTVKVTPLPVVTITGPNSVCPGENVTLNATGGGTYLWNNGVNTSSVTVDITHDSTLYVIVTNGCTDTTYHKVTVTPAIPVVACCDTTIAPGGMAFINASGATGYVWVPSGNIECYTCPNTSATPGATTTYTVVGTDSNGCQSAAYVTVTIACDNNNYTVPNVFTPNNDNHNDYFVINAYEVNNYSIEIYNRWGILMYKSDTPYAPWSGKDMSGKPVPDGVYYYIIKTQCGGSSTERHGFVQVIR